MLDSPAAWLLTGVIGFFMAIGVTLAFTSSFIEELTARIRGQPHVRWLIIVFAVGAFASAALWEESSLWRIGLVVCGVAHSYVAWRLFEYTDGG